MPPHITKKAREVYEIAKKYPYTRRIILSDNSMGPVELRSSKDIKYDSQINRKASKPHGVWYSFGRAWADFLWDKQIGDQWGYTRLDQVTHIYGLRLNYEFVYRIKTIDQFEQFESLFANKKRTWINWEKVADTWAGIEIRFIPPKSDGESPWYEHWDVSSGCVWHPEAVKKIKTLHQWQAKWIKII